MKRRCEARRSGVRDKTRRKHEDRVKRQELGTCGKGWGVMEARDGEGAGNSWMLVEPL